MRRLKKCPDTPKSLRGLAAPSSPDEINEKLYGKADVKEQLNQDQSRKCAYCECLLNGDFGDIEHYRPKSGYVTASGAYLTPGYYWLAYSWENLLLSCSKCNRSHKRNHFGLKDENVRDIANRDISRENPLLINPYVDDPAEFIIFHQHIAAPRMIDGRKSERGKYTIDTLKLNDRAELRENRRKKWHNFHARLKQIYAVAVELKEVKGMESQAERLIDTIKKDIQDYTSPDAEYSSMFINNSYRAPGYEQDY